MSFANPTRTRQWPTTLATAVVLIFLLLPTLIIIPLSLGTEKFLQFPPRAISLQWYKAYFEDEQWLRATTLSLMVAASATILSVLVTLPACLGLARRDFTGAGLLRAAMLAPMILPHIVIAVGLYISFAKIGLSGTTIGLVAAMTILCVPFLYLTLSAAIGELDPSLGMAAASLGATTFTSFRLVSLPLLAPAIVAGMAFAFINALDEAVVSNFLSGSTSKTLMKKMFEDIDFDVSPVIAAVSTMILAGSLALIGFARIYGRLRSQRAANQTVDQRFGNGAA